MWRWPGLDVKAPRDKWWCGVWLMMMFTYALCFVDYAAGQTSWFGMQRGVFKNCIGMEFAWIPPGVVKMGCSSEQTLETTGEVCITRGFFLSVTEVTEGQWLAVMKRLPVYKFDVNCHGQDLPVVYVSWYDGLEFCRRLAAMDGRRYRYPTSAEWEHACKGRSDKLLYAPLEEIATKYVKWELFTPNRVRDKAPNSVGLFDMVGNVWEWCLDSPRWSRYSEAPRGNDYLAREDFGSCGGKRVCRGGWTCDDDSVGCIFANMYDSEEGHGKVGVRILMETDGREGNGPSAWKYFEENCSSEKMNVAARYWNNEKVDSVSRPHSEQEGRAPHRRCEEVIDVYSEWPGTFK